MRYNNSVTIRNTAKAAANVKPVKSKRMCSHRLQLSNTHRTHLPYALTTRSASSQRRAAYLHPAAKTHPPPCKGIKTKQNQIESRPQSSHPSIGMFVSTVIKVKLESNSIQPAGQQQEHRYHGVNRVPCAVRHCGWHSKDVGCR